MATDEQMVIFKLADADYGIPIAKVMEINRMIVITKLPQTPEFMEGVINLRGRVIPVIDLRKRFGLEAKEQDDDTRIMIIDVDAQTVGIIVDAVREVFHIPGTSIEPPPPSFVLDARYIEGIGKLEDRLVILLNIDRVMTSQETILLRQAVQGA